MSVNYNTDVLNSRLQDVADAIDAGGAPGVLRLMTGGGFILSSMPFARPCGTVAGGVLSFVASLIDPAAAGAGTAATAQCEDSTGTVIISGLTVSTGTGTDIIMTPTNVIAAGQVIAITAASITGN